MRALVALLVAAVVALAGCGRLLAPSGQPIPGPTHSVSPTGTGTGIPGAAEEGAGPEETVTEGPDVTG